MENLTGIKIPNHWLIDTGIKEYWPHKEGIWVDDKTAPFLRVAVVYHSLLDIPEAQSHLTKCNEKFLNENARVLLQYVNSVKEKAKARGKLSEVKSPYGAEDDETVFSIYRPWVEKWALGSEKMLKWVVGFYMGTISLDLMKLSRGDKRRFYSRLSELGDKYPLPWMWKILLSGEYHRIDQAKRELARRTVQSKGFYRVRERALWTHAEIWVIIRVLGVNETDFLQKYLPEKSITNLSTDILSKFDDALLEKDSQLKPGRPLGSQNTLNIAKILREQL